MKAVEDIIVEEGIMKVLHNVAETLVKLRKDYPDCQQLITDSLEDIRVKNNLSFSWDELISTETITKE